MTITVVNQRHTRAGEYIGRPSPLGNPFTHLPGTTAQTRVATRAAAVARYHAWLLEQVRARNSHVTAEIDRLARLAVTSGDLVLRCWCAPQACHGDVLKVYLEQGIAAGHLPRALPPLLDFPELE